MFLISGQTSITHLLAMVVYIVIEEISDVQLRHTFLKVLVFDNEVQVFVLDVQGHVRSSVFFAVSIFHRMVCLWSVTGFVSFITKTNTYCCPHLSVDHYKLPFLRE